MLMPTISAARGLLAITAVMMCAAPAAAQPAASQGGVSGRIAVGAGLAPDYQGSSDYQALPLVSGEISYGDVSLEFEGPQGRLGVSLIEGLSFGPAFRYRGQRDDDVENDAVSRLSEVDEAFEVGGFVRYGAPVGMLRNDSFKVQAELLTDVNGSHSGLVGSVSAGYSFRALERMFLTTTLSSSFGDQSFVDTYFGVSPGDAAASGLSAFDAGGGVTDVGLGLSAYYQLSSQWGVVGIASVKQLVGDAADSPIVDDEGSATQFFLGAGVGYQF